MNPPQTPDNEVERLRELLNRAIEIADEAITPLQRSEYSMDGDMLYRQLERLRDVPLEGDIESIEWSCAHTARAIRYLLQQINTLRDEIQKLKEK